MVDTNICVLTNQMTSNNNVLALCSLFTVNRLYHCILIITRMCERKENARCCPECKVANEKVVELGPYYMNTGTSIVSGGENSNMDIQTLSVLIHTVYQDSIIAQYF